MIIFLLSTYGNKKNKAQRKLIDSHSYQNYSLHLLQGQTVKSDKIWNSNVNREFIAINKHWNAFFWHRGDGVHPHVCETHLWISRTSGKRYQVYKWNVKKLFWRCPKLRLYWQGLILTLNDLYSITLPPHPTLCILGYVDSDMLDSNLPLAVIASPFIAQKPLAARRISTILPSVDALKSIYCLRNIRTSFTVPYASLVWFCPVG